MSLGSEMTRIYMDAYEEAFSRYKNKQLAIETAMTICICFRMSEQAKQEINPFEAFLKAVMEHNGGDDE